MKSFLCVFLLIVVSAGSVVSVDQDSIANPPVLDPVTFVRNIELAEPSYKFPDSLRNSTLAKLGNPPQDNKKEAYVVGGAVTAFTDTLTGLAKQDILDGTLFAQLSADKNYDRETDVVSWYSYYEYVLENLGFQIVPFVFDRYQNGSGNSTTMNKVVLDVLASISTPNQTAVIKETLSIMQSMKSTDERIVLLSQRSATSSSGNFQVYPCNMSPDGKISMSMSAFYFMAPHYEVRFLFSEYDSATIRIFQGTQKAVFNQDVYAKVRSEISTKLGGNAAYLMASIALS